MLGLLQSLSGCASVCHGKGHPPAPPRALELGLSLPPSVAHRAGFLGREADSWATDWGWCGQGVLLPTLGLTEAAGWHRSQKTFQQQKVPIS